MARPSDRARGPSDLSRQGVSTGGADPSRVDLAADMAILLAEDTKQYRAAIHKLRAAVDLARGHLIVNDIALPNVQEVLDDALAETVCVATWDARDSGSDPTGEDPQGLSAPASQSGPQGIAQSDAAQPESSP